MKTRVIEGWVGVVLMVLLFGVSSCQAEEDAVAGDTEPAQDTGSSGDADAASATDTAADTAAEEVLDSSTAPDVTAVTWAEPVQGFFATYCVTCHASSPKDFRLYTDVVGRSENIRCGVAPTLQSGCESNPYAPRQFPVGGGPKPTDEERQMIVDWIDAGMPE